MQLSNEGPSAARDESFSEATVRDDCDWHGKEGCLAIVGTPIGNLSDLSPRAIEVLGTFDRICCEDTRRTRGLLSAFGLPANPRRLVSLHAHNERGRIPQVLSWVESGERIAIVSDAGLPGISDPGERLVSEALDHGLRVTVVPGPSAALAALVLSGMKIDRFCVEGFLPRKGRAREMRLEELASESRTSVLFESPERLVATLSELCELGGDRLVAVVREATKVHEEVWRGTLVEAVETYSNKEVRGEIAVVLSGADLEHGTSPEEVRTLISKCLEDGKSPREAASVAVLELGVGRHAAYELAIKLRDSFANSGSGSRETR
ncbi:MAG: 16S rRNA (cytidine(1402)-2'-O)-methyltransferase [Actinobacteria bacterium]|nr:16S rRNA (cytidine(1402)-2'-O)-methyltransferase [Actinomycetota bacterium]MCL5444738.1 16S rRNA (cytidine(1402)-2'-O)-methyltransferase [Actinomycetota bacterium]